jgi:hypothetical protein
VSSRPNWSEWILQKNNEAQQEELKKSDSVMRSGQESLKKWFGGPFKNDTPFNPHHVFAHKGDHYEKLFDHPEHKYRKILSSNDYDYVEHPDHVRELDSASSHIKQA